MSKRTMRRYCELMESDRDEAVINDMVSFITDMTTMLLDAKDEPLKITYSALTPSEGDATLAEVDEGVKDGDKVGKEIVVEEVLKAVINATEALDLDANTGDKVDGEVLEEMEGNGGAFSALEKAEMGARLANATAA